MKIPALALSIVLFSLASFGQGFGRTAAFNAVSVKAVATNSQSCITWVVQTNANDYFDSAIGVLSQSISNQSASAQTICQVDAFLNGIGGSCQVYFQIWTAQNKGGSQWGGNSNTNSVLNTGDAWYTFSFPTANRPVTTGSTTFYLTLQTTGANSVAWDLSNANPYGGVSYQAFTGSGGNSSDDYAFKIYDLQ